MTEVFFSFLLSAHLWNRYCMPAGDQVLGIEMGRSVPVIKLLKSSVEDRKQTLQSCDTINATH